MRKRQGGNGTKPGRRDVVEMDFLKVLLRQSCRLHATVLLIQEVTFRLNLFFCSPHARGHPWPCLPDMMSHRRLCVQFVTVRTRDHVCHFNRFVVNNNHDSLSCAFDRTLQDGGGCWSDATSRAACRLLWRRAGFPREYPQVQRNTYRRAESQQ